MRLPLNTNKSYGHSYTSELSPEPSQRLLNGTGTEDDPFEIATAEELDLVRCYLGQENAGVYFALANDIDLASYLEAGSAGNNNDVFWNPIGDGAHPFMGRFDGRHHNIYGLRINRPATNYIGLWGCLGAAGVIHDLGVEAVDIIGHDYVGGLLGASYGAISSCYATGTVRGHGSVGGLMGVGDESASVSMCYSLIATSGDNGVGGLVGYNSSRISNCYSRSTVNGSSYGFGGLVGLDLCGTIVNSYAAGGVLPTSSSAGGLIGWGWDEGAEPLPPVNSYWDTDQTGQAFSVRSTAAAGGKSSVDMKLRSTYTGWDFSDACIWEINTMKNDGYPRLTWQTETPAKASIAVGEPVSESENFQSCIVFAGGNGTRNDPFQITTAAELNLVRKYLNELHRDKYFRLMNDIDLTEYLSALGEGFAAWGISGWLPIGELCDDCDMKGYFHGKFDGNHHKITGLKIDRGYPVRIGLWGWLGGDGEVKDLAVEIDPTEHVRGTANGVGGLVGTNYGSITNCSTNGEVRGINEVGELVGINYGSITNCHTQGEVSGITHVGELVGTNFGSIADCSTRR
jgi:The GLUG motif